MADQQGHKKNGVKFGLHEYLYHYEAFTGGNVERDVMRKEYSRLRQVANKRLERMKGTRYENTQTYLKNAGKYTTLADIEKQALKHAKKMNPKNAEAYVDAITAKKLADLYKFLTAKTGSIRGMQKVENQTIEVLRERGFTFINKGNIQQFGDFMEHMRSLNLGKIYESERAAELFGVATKKGIDPMQLAQDFMYWQQNVEALAKLPKIKNPKQRTAAHYKKLLEKR